MDHVQPAIPPDAFVATSREDLMLPVHAALEETAKAGRPDVEQLTAALAAPQV